MNLKRALFFVGLLVAVVLALRMLRPPAVPSKGTEKDHPAAAGEPETSPSIASRLFGNNSGKSGTPGFSAELIQLHSQSRLTSEKAREEFKRVGLLELRFPDNYRFQNLELDFPNIMGIYAKTEKVEVTVLAGRLNPNEQELMDFFKERDTGIPNLDNRGITLKGTPVQVKPHGGSGLKAGKYWQGVTADGEGARVGLAERADGKGSYLFIFTGDENKLDNSDEVFDEIYQSLKAVP